ncbi:MAG: hypothetical protein DRN31_01075 [Thermoplasmata archaeon]|nr:MAG: hypothetical protein DRN31_01075 [Thermoplasmata archaeon]
MFILKMLLSSLKAEGCRAYKSHKKGKLSRLLTHAIWQKHCPTFQEIQAGGEKMSEEEVKEVIGKVMHPEVDASLVELGMVENVEVKGNKVSLTMVFPFAGVPIKYMLIESVKEPLEKLGLEVEITERTMSQDELQKFFKMEQEKWKGM